MHAALTIRNTYFHSLETFFSLLCAAIQAPHFPVAWVMKCTTPELRDIIAIIKDRKNALLTYLNLDSISFNSLSQIIFNTIGFGDEDKNRNSNELFAELWSNLASDFLDEQKIDEYNCIKHGLRLKTGGFQLAVGKQDGFNDPCSPEKMQNIGGSMFGASFLSAKKEGKYRKGKFAFQYGLGRNNITWDPQSIADKVKLCSMSINNVLCFLKNISKIKDDIQPIRPKNDEIFSRPWWQLSCPEFNFTTTLEVCDKNIPEMSREDIVKLYNKQ
jgi:hypothetical protein